MIDAPDDIKSTSTISTINKYVVIFKYLLLNCPDLYDKVQAGVIESI